MNDQTKIVELIQQVTGKPIQPTPEESLFDSGVLDSFTLADLVGELEREFQIKIPDGDLTPRKFDTVERIAKYVASRK